MSKTPECISSNNIRKIDKNSSNKWTITTTYSAIKINELSTSENVEIFEKDKNEPLQRIIEKDCDIIVTLDENIENRRIKTFSCKKCEYYEQINV